MKVCGHCGVAYARAYKMTDRQWAARRFCSLACSLAYVAGTGLPCAVDACETTARGQSAYCNTHRQRVRKHGDPLHERWASAWDRFVNRVQVLADDCWQWTGGRSGRYGEFWFDNRNSTAHRYAYATLVGPIPAGLDLDHLCRNTLCVNPAHLEPVTRSENTRRMRAALRSAAA